MSKRKATKKKTSCKGKGCNGPSKKAIAATKKIVKQAKALRKYAGKKEVVTKKKVNKMSWSDAVKKSAKQYRLTKKK